MEDEKQDNVANESPSTEPVKEEPTSIYDKTEAIVVRQEEANKKTEELLQRQETLHANQRLAGTTGGHIEAKVIPEEQKQATEAANFFEGTQLEKDIKLANKLDG